MKKMKPLAVIEEHYDILVDKGYEVVCVALYGSQNYHMDTSNSDVDSKAIVLPKLDDIILNRPPISKTINMPYGGLCDVKDIRQMFKNFKKQNINFLEILFTEYYICNEKYIGLIEELLLNREAIAHYNNYALISAIVGMVTNKYKMMEHLSPATEDAIKKYGYDPKQLHHMERLYDFLFRYTTTDDSFKKLLTPNNIDDVMRYKTNPIPLEEARKEAKDIYYNVGFMKETYMAEHKLTINHDIDTLLDNLASETIKMELREELLNDNTNTNNDGRNIE